MQSSDNSTLQEKRKHLLQYGIPGIIILLVALVGLGVFRTYYMRSGEDMPLSVADVLVMQITSTSQAIAVTDNIRNESEIVRIQWYEQIHDKVRLRDTVLRFGTTGSEEEVIKQILAKSQAMDPEQIQSALKRTIHRSAAIELDPQARKWALILVGSLKFKENLIDAKETETLQHHSKLSVMFFRNPVDQPPSVNDLVSDEFTRLLRNKGITVKEVFLR